MNDNSGLQRKISALPSIPRKNVDCLHCTVGARDPRPRVQGFMTHLINLSHTQRRDPDSPERIYTSLPIDSPRSFPHRCPTGQLLFLQYYELALTSLPVVPNYFEVAEKGIELAKTSRLLPFEEVDAASVAAKVISELFSEGAKYPNSRFRKCKE